MPDSPGSGSGTFTLIVGPFDAGLRLDRFVSSKLPACTRSFCANLIGRGHVRVAGQPAKPGYRVKVADSVSVYIPPPSPVETIAEPIPLDILYQDSALLVLNKQAGLVVHPAPGHTRGTLVNGLLFHCPDLGGIGGEIRPGIVHRLDKDTSGALVVAKHADAHLHLARQFKSRSVKKEYLALVYGRVDGVSGGIDLSIGRHPTDRKRMSTRSRKGRSAETLWRVRERFEGATLLSLDLKTGRTHQIRVHCAAIGHPVVGDPVYAARRGRTARRNKGGGGPSERLIAGARRQMLHARRLSFIHPDTGRGLSFEAPLPGDMAQMLDTLRGISLQ